VKPRVVTGLGIACALGTGAEAFFEAMKAPERLSKRPPAPIASFDASKYDRALPIVEVPGFDPTKYLGDKGLRTLDRLTKLLVVAARLCLHDANIKKEGQWTSTLGAERVGVCCSNAYGSLEAITELDRVAVLEDARYINPAKFPNTVSNSAAGYVSIWEELRALNVTVSDGNCGALDAVSCADIFLATSRADAILTGGGEAMSEALFLAFERLGALGDGRLGEGAAFLALEEPEAAKARGAKRLAEITGYATAFSAPGDSSLVHASSVAMERAIAQALDDAKTSAKDVDLVASSVSGLETFDGVELAAIEKNLAQVPVAAPKLVLGETLGACGAMSMAAALAWFAGAPPTAVVRGEAPAKVDTVLITTIGYYGNASALVMHRV
jgi:3-oxoacyl-(acyl-carrier-protein) synthase